MHLNKLMNCDLTFFVDARLRSVAHSIGSVIVSRAIAGFFSRSRGLRHHHKRSGYGSGFGLLTVKHRVITLPTISRRYIKSSLLFSVD